MSDHARTPLAHVKRFLSRFMALRNYCHFCGRRAEPFTSTDKAWADSQMYGDYEILCLRCWAAMIVRWHTQCSESTTFSVDAEAHRRRHTAGAAP